MVRPENGVFRADPGLRKFVGAFKIAIFLTATVSYNQKVYLHTLRNESHLLLPLVYI